MNRFVSQVVLSTINNKKLLQILLSKKLNENDLLLPSIIKFKKFFNFDLRKIIEYINITLEYIIWINKFYYFDWIFSNKYYCKITGFALVFCYYGHLDVVNYLKSKN